MYDVAYQYAILDWYDSVTSEAIDWDLKPEHLAFMTPRKKEELFGEPESLITVSVDLSDPDNPRLAEDPIEIGTVDAEMRYRLGHSYPANKTSNMTDYSITTHKSADAHHLAGLRDDAWGTANVQDRFTRWAQSDAAQQAIEDGIEDAWIIEALAELGEDDDAMERLKDTFLQKAGGEDEEFDALLTVRIKLPDEEEYRYPGEIDALNDVMVRQKADRLENVSVEDAGGEGVGYVTGEEGRVTGGSPGLLGTYGKKQREHFPNLSPSGEEAWRSRPLQHDVAAAVANADGIFDRFYSALGQSRRLYVLPYLAPNPESLDAATIEWFFEEVFDRLRDADGEAFEGAVKDIYYSVADAGAPSELPSLIGDVLSEDEAEAWDDIQFAIVLQVTGNPDRILFESRPATVYWPARLSDEHSRIAQETFRNEGDPIFGDISSEYPELLDPEVHLERQVLFGTYFEETTEPTRSSRESQETPRAGDFDDPRARRLERLLDGEPIALEPLLEEYLHKLVQDQNHQFGRDDVSLPFPTTSVLEQYVQLRALVAADLVTAAGDTDLDTTFTTTMSDTNSTQTDEQSREERLTEFIESHDALSNKQRESVFLLGALVGRISAYQRSPGIDVSSTLIRRYPIDYITRQTIQEVTSDVLRLNNTYSESDDRLSGIMNRRYTTRLTDAMLDRDPSEWELSQTELQWLYGLGIAYGTNDTSFDTEDEN